MSPSDDRQTCPFLDNHLMRNLSLPSPLPRYHCQKRRLQNSTALLVCQSLTRPYPPTREAFPPCTSFIVVYSREAQLIVGLPVLLHHARPRPRICAAAGRARLSSLYLPRTMSF